MRKDREVRFGPADQAIDFSQLPSHQARAVLPDALPAEEQREDASIGGSLGEPITIREVAQLVGCSAWTVRQQCMRQGLPYFRASRTGKLIFYRNQVIRWLIEKQKTRR